ncbi:MAG: hypothetical protein AB7P04_06825 [Bacteriovoracia bacterium]
MKKISKITFGLLIWAGFSSAIAQAEVKVEITSFYEVIRGGRMAEVCGKVTGATADQLKNMHVEISPDYRSKNAGHYATVVDKEGRYCAVVVTFYGEVQAEAWDKTAKLTDRTTATVVSILK